MCILPFLSHSFERFAYYSLHENSTPCNFTSFFQELLPDNRGPLLGNYDQAWLTAAEGLACTAAAACAPSRRPQGAIPYCCRVGSLADPAALGVKSSRISNSVMSLGKALSPKYIE